MATPAFLLDLWCRRQQRAWPGLFDLRVARSCNGSSSARNSCVPSSRISHQLLPNGTACILINSSRVAFCDGCADIVPLRVGDALSPADFLGPVNGADTVVCSSCSFTTLLNPDVRRCLGLDRFCAGLRLPADVARFVVLEALGGATFSNSDPSWNAAGPVGNACAARTEINDVAESGDWYRYVQSLERRSQSAQLFLDFISVRTQAGRISVPNCRSVGTHLLLSEGESLLGAILAEYNRTSSIERKETPSCCNGVQGGEQATPFQGGLEFASPENKFAVLGVATATPASSDALENSGSECVNARAASEKSAELAKDALVLHKGLSHTDSVPSIEQDVRLDALRERWLESQCLVRTHIWTCGRCFSVAASL